MDILAVIPARGGSVRLPGKNIKPLNGKPLLSYPIEAWKQSKYSDGNRSCLVTSDSDEILKVAREYGADVLKRPPYLAASDTPTQPVIQHVIEYLLRYQGYRAGVIVILQPTSPLRIGKDIDDCLDLYFSGQCDSVTTVTNGKENGAVYVTHANIVIAGNIYGNKVAKWETPPERSIDIDTLEDFEKAERFLKGEKENDSSAGLLHKLDRPENGKGNGQDRKGMRLRTNQRPTL